MLNPAAAYPDQIDTTDPTGYPYGRAKNSVTLEDGTGTPLEQQWVSDLFGSQQALLAAAELTPSGTPDKVGASQHLDAIKIVADARTKLALQKSQALNWPERGSFHNSGDYASPNGVLDMAWAPDLGIGGGGRYVLIGPGNTAGCNTWSSEDCTQWDFGGLLSAAEPDNPCVAYGRINGTPGFLMTWASPIGYYSSINGTSWGSVSETVPAHGVACYSSSLNMWVIAGDSGEIRTSLTALAGSWTARTTPAGWIAGCGGVKRVIFANGLFVILPKGIYNKVLTSPNGITWTERTLATGTWTGIAYSSTDQLWLAIGIGAGVYSSANGTSWNFVTSSLASMNDLACSGPVWVATTNNGSFGGIAYSTNKGANWSYVAVGNHRVATAGWTRILGADGRFMVAHATGAVCEVALSARAMG